MREYKTNHNYLASALFAIMLIAVLALVAGCGSDDKTSEVTNESVVLYVKDESVLMADIDTEAVYFPYIPENALFSQDGKNIKASDLTPGDLVLVTGNGAMAESYPAQYPGISKIEIIGFDDSYIDQYEYIISRIFADTDPDEIPSAYVEYEVEDVGSITVALEPYTYSIDTPNGTKEASGSIIAQNGAVLEGVPDMVISDTNYATIGFTADISDAAVKCIPTYETNGVRLSADPTSSYSIEFELEDSSVSLKVEPGYLYTVKAKFENGEAYYAFLVK